MQDLLERRSAASAGRSLPSAPASARCAPSPEQLLVRINGIYSVHIGDPYMHHPRRRLIRDSRRAQDHSLTNLYDTLTGTPSARLTGELPPVSDLWHCLNRPICSTPRRQKHDSPTLMMIFRRFAKKGSNRFLIFRSHVLVKTVLVCFKDPPLQFVYISALDLLGKLCFALRTKFAQQSQRIV